MNSTLDLGECYDKFRSVVVVALSAADVAHKFLKLAEVEEMFDNLNLFLQMVRSTTVGNASLIEKWEPIKRNSLVEAPAEVSHILCKDTLSTCDRKFLHDNVQEMKVKIAYDKLKWGSIASFFVICGQISRLVEVYRAVEDAQNVIRNSAQQIQSIKDKMVELLEGAIELRVIMTQYETESTSEQKKVKLMRKLERKLRRISLTFNAARIMISELKVEISGKTEVLAAYQREQVTNAFLNIIQGTCNLAQCIQFWDALGPGMKFLQLTISGSFFGLTLGNAVMKNMTAKTLKELRQVMDEIHEMENQLASINASMKAAEDFVDRHEDD